MYEYIEGNNNNPIPTMKVSMDIKNIASYFKSKDPFFVKEIYFDTSHFDTSRLYKRGGFVPHPKTCFGIIRYLKQIVRAGLSCESDAHMILYGGMTDAEIGNSLIVLKTMPKMLSNLIMTGTLCVDSCVRCCTGIRVVFDTNGLFSFKCDDIFCNDFIFKTVDMSKGVARLFVNEKSRLDYLTELIQTYAFDTSILVGVKDAETQRLLMFDMEVDDSESDFKSLADNNFVVQVCIFDRNDLQRENN